MNKYINEFKKLCTPAFLYFSLSIFSILIMAFQNLNSNNKYCVGMFECSVPNTLFIFLLKVLYVLFWTFILNLLCKNGFKEMAWFLFLLPFILLFIIIGLFILNSGARLIKN